MGRRAGPRQQDSTRGGSEQDIESDWISVRGTRTDLG